MIKKFKKNKKQNKKPKLCGKNKIKNQNYVDCWTIKENGQIKRTSMKMKRTDLIAEFNSCGIRRIMLSLISRNAHGKNR